MRDKELCRLIGRRVKQRKVALGLNQPYVADVKVKSTSRRNDSCQTLI